MQNGRLAGGIARGFQAGEVMMEENKNVGKRLCLEDVGRNIRMNRVVGLSLRSHRHKNLGPNSQLGVHGSTASERILQIHTDIGVVGWGFFRAESESAASLLGRNPVELLCDQSHGLGPATMPLWDLVGKLLSKPVYELLGNRGCSRVPVYDSSIYFADLMPEYAKDYRDWFKKEVDMGLEMGHRAFKVKIGRGAKWMPQEEGNARDREILEIIRRHAGPDILIGADANNAYDPYHCRQLLGDLAELKLAFVEEMFPESVEECLSLKGFIAQNRWNTLVADGESAKTLDELRPLIESKALDVFQGDMPVSYTHLTLPTN